MDSIVHITSDDINFIACSEILDLGDSASINLNHVNSICKHKHFHKVELMTRVATKSYFAIKINYTGSHDIITFGSEELRDSKFKILRHMFMNHNRRKKERGMYDQT